MKPFVFIALLAFSCSALFAQPHASAKPSAALHTSTSDVGFSYSLPADWEFVDMSASLSALQKQTQQTAGDDELKRGAACMQIALTAHHGTPGSMIAAVVLPSDCMGKEMAPTDLPGFGIAATQGVQMGFDVGDPLLAEYSLGSHKVWAARAKGNPAGHPEMPYTVETVCTLVKKGAVCWMALAANDASLATFEKGSVALDKEAPTALVPTSAFVKKP
jgi:hypothetical protein